MYRDGSGEPSPSLSFCLCAAFYLRHPGAGLSADERQLTVLIGLSPSPCTPRTASTLSTTEVSLSPLPVTTLPESNSGIVPTSKAPSEGAMLRKGCLPTSFGGNGNVSAEGNIQLSRIGFEGKMRFRFHTPLLPTTHDPQFLASFSFNCAVSFSFSFFQR